MPSGPLDLGDQARQIQAQDAGLCTAPVRSMVPARAPSGWWAFCGVCRMYTVVYPPCLQNSVRPLKISPCSPV